MAVGHRGARRRSRASSLACDGARAAHHRRPWLGPSTRSNSEGEPSGRWGPHMKPQSRKFFSASVSTRAAFLIGTHPRTAFFTWDRVFVFRFQNSEKIPNPFFSRDPPPDERPFARPAFGTAADQQTHHRAFLARRGAVASASHGPSRRSGICGVGDRRKPKRWCEIVGVVRRLDDIGGPVDVGFLHFEQISGPKAYILSVNINRRHGSVRSASPVVIAALERRGSQKASCDQLDLPKRFISEGIFSPLQMKGAPPLV